MKKLSPALLLLSLAALLLAATASATDPAGKQIFLDAKCNKCHAIESQSIAVLAPGEDEEAEEGETKPPDLSNASANFKKASDVAAWITKKADRDGKKHRSMFRGTAPELKTLTEWMMTLKKAK